MDIENKEGQLEKEHEAAIRRYMRRTFLFGIIAGAIVCAAIIFTVYYLMRNGNW